MKAAYSCQSHDASRATQCPAAICGQPECCFEPVAGMTPAAHRSRKVVAGRVLASSVQQRPITVGSATALLCDGHDLGVDASIRRLQRVLLPQRQVVGPACQCHSGTRTTTGHTRQPTDGSAIRYRRTQRPVLRTRWRRDHPRRHSASVNPRVVHGQHVGAAAAGAGAGAIVLALLEEAALLGGHGREHERRAPWVQLLHVHLPQRRPRGGRPTNDEA